MHPQTDAAKGSLGSMASIRNYPRVLVIEPTPFNWHSCTGILKSRLFVCWPKDRLPQIVYSNVKPSFDVCERYCRPSKRDILKGLRGRSSRSVIERIPPRQEVFTKPTSVFEYDSRPRIERILSGQIGRAHV